MSNRVYIKFQVQQNTLMGSSPKSSFLQRTCACGQHILAGGECATCRNERSALLRFQRAFGSPSALPAVQGNFAAQENVPSLNSSFDRTSRFGHDFSRIPVYSSHPPVLQTKLKINPPPELFLSTGVKSSVVTPLAGVEELGEVTQRFDAFRVASYIKVRSQAGLEAIRKEAGGKALGVTIPFNDTGKVPQFEQDEPLPENNQWRARVKRTTSSPPDTHTLYLTPGRYLYALGEGPGLEEILIVDDELSKHILEGEKEHIQDFDLAYKLSWKKIEDIINALAERKLPLQANREEARLSAQRAFLEKLKELGLQFIPDNVADPKSQRTKWLEILKQLQDFSHRRDDFWHDMPLHRERSNDGRHWEWKFDPSQTLHLGHRSEEIIHLETSKK